MIGHVHPFWNTTVFEKFQWISEKFNDSDQKTKWIKQGYRDNIVGSFIDITSDQFPADIKTFFQSWLNLNDIGMTIYKMRTDEILPIHFDTYRYYKKIFNLSDSVSIYRTIVFLENWKSGHYLDVDNVPYVNWRAGDYVSWTNNTPHMAANIGVAPRYTLQITGWKLN